MSKSIFTVGLPESLTEEAVSSHAKLIFKQLSTDYHVIFYKTPSLIPTFEMYSEHNIPKVEFNKLLLLVEEQLKKYKFNLLHSLKDEYV